MTKRLRLSRLLSVLIFCAALSPLSPALASSQIVTLVCVPYRPGTFGQGSAFTVTIDYGESAAQKVTSTTPQWLPAEITAKTIKWTNLIRWPGGRTTEDRWTIERYSGLLTRAEVGTALCAKPAPMLSQIAETNGEGEPRQKF